MIDKDVWIDYGNDMYYDEHWSNGQLEWKGIMFNDSEYGYQEYYNEDDSIDEYITGYYLDGKMVSDDNEKGYCLIWWWYVL